MQGLGKNQGGKKWLLENFKTARVYKIYGLLKAVSSLNCLSACNLLKGRGTGFRAMSRPSMSPKDKQN